MILVDSALRAREAEGRPIRVAIVGTGFMARGLASQIARSVVGMQVVAMYGRRPERAIAVLDHAGLDSALVSAQADLEDVISAGKVAVTADPAPICEAEQVDVIVEATGSVEFGASVVLEAFRGGKHVVLLNAELDGTLGPILQRYADRHGVMLSASDGDEPGLQMNLVRWLIGLGFTPRVLGNVKGLHDPYRNPTTQQAFAEIWGQKPAMVTSFADGTKLSFEQAIVGNATGFTVLARGMSRGQRYDGPITEISSRYDLDEVRARGGIVDYTVGPPGVKVFCLAEHGDERQRPYLDLYKLGKGPLYSFWTPYHLPHLEVPTTIARVALFGDTVARPIGGPVVEVCAVAKRDLEAGEVLDGCGMYMTYGEAVNAKEMCVRRYLPEGLVEGCKLVRGVPRDGVLTYDDVELPIGRVADRLRGEQYRHFFGETWLENRVAREPDDPGSTGATADDTNVGLEPVDVSPRELS